MEIKSKLELIAEKASKDGKLKFTSLVHLINKDRTRLFVTLACWLAPCLLAFS